jgi:prephenate dehydrogenase
MNKNCIRKSKEINQKKKQGGEAGSRASYVRQRGQGDVVIVALEESLTHRCLERLPPRLPV